MIGYCMGGGLALLLAPDRGFAVASVNYGTASKDAYTASFLAGACPIVGSYGGRDRSLRGAAARLEQALAVPGSAGHEFLNDHEGAGAKLRPVLGSFRDPDTTRHRRKTPAGASSRSSARTCTRPGPSAPDDGTRGSARAARGHSRGLQACRDLWP